MPDAPPPPPDRPSPAVEVRDLTVRYGTLVAVDALRFTAHQGQITAILGPNGAGKTTTMETLEGYKRPTSGTVRVLGLDPVAQHAELTPQIGVMLQDGGVHTGIRPLEALELFASYYPRPEDPAELLERVGLTHRRTTTWRHLSGGEKQRLSLALALVGRPRVVFLDEPTAGIDPSGRQVIRSVIRQLRDRGVAVLVTTHDLDEAQRLADRVVIVDHGRVLADGTPDDLRRVTATDDAGAEIRFGGPSGLDVTALGRHLGDLVVTEVTPGEYVVAGAGSPATIAALATWMAERDLVLDDLRAARQSLEDVFLRLTAEAAATTDQPGSPADGDPVPRRRRRATRRPDRGARS